MKKSWGMVFFVLLALLIIIIATAWASPGEVKIPNESPKNWVQLAYVALIVITVNVPTWIREVVKTIEFKKKNGMITGIKADTSDLKTTIGLMDQKINLQQKACKTTTDRFEKAISNNQDVIITHLEKN